MYVADRDTNTSELVSTSTGGTQANNNSVPVAVSAGGRYVLFSSDATTLVSNPGNHYGTRHLYLRDRTARPPSR